MTPLAAFKFHGRQTGRGHLALWDLLRHSNENQKKDQHKAGLLFFAPLFFKS
jgi:hypothetical protein